MTFGQVYFNRLPARIEMFLGIRPFYHFVFSFKSEVGNKWAADCIWKTDENRPSTFDICNTFGG